MIGSSEAGPTGSAIAFLTLQVVDHGAGFDCNGALAEPVTCGIAGMRERAMLLGGRVAVESAPGTGTRLRAEFPLHGDGEVVAATPSTPSFVRDLPPLWSKSST